MTFASLRATIDGFNADKAPRLAAAIAYTTIFSIAPLFIVLIAVATAILGKDAHAEDTLIAFIAQNAGSSAADAVRGIVEASQSRPRVGLIAQIVAWVAFAVGASSLFSTLQDALNTVWGVESTKGGWKWIVRSRLLSFGMVVVFGFLLLVTFIASGAVTVVATYFAHTLPFAADPRVLAAVEFVLSLVVESVVFGLLFKVLPDVDVAWRDTWLGAIATAVLFTIGEFAISLYFTFAGVQSTYGAAGSLLVALLWIYYSAMIVLLGAEFTKVHAKRARLQVDSLVREVSDRPAGDDPRKPADVPEHPYSPIIR